MRNRLFVIIFIHHIAKLGYKTGFVMISSHSFLKRL